MIFAKWLFSEFHSRSKLFIFQILMHALGLGLELFVLDIKTNVPRNFSLFTMHFFLFYDNTQVFKVKTQTGREN